MGAPCIPSPKGRGFTALSDNFDRNNVIKAALEVLHCTDLPFLLVIPDCTKLKTYSRTSAIDHAKECSAEYVTCRLNDDKLNKLAFTFDDKPVPEPAIPHGYGFICGRCATPEGAISYAKPISYVKLCILDERGKKYYVNTYGEARKYAEDKIQFGDSLELKVRLNSVTNTLDICSLVDILSHTRVVTTELEVSLR